MAKALQRGFQEKLAEPAESAREEAMKVDIEALCRSVHEHLILFAKMQQAQNPNNLKN